MKRSKLTEIKSSSIPELVKQVATLRGEMVDLTLDKNMGKLKDNKSVFKKRKDLAKILTVLRQKEMLESLESRINNLESSEKTEEKAVSKKDVGQVRSKKGVKS